MTRFTLPYQHIQPSSLLQIEAVLLRGYADGAIKISYEGWGKAQQAIVRMEEAQKTVIPEKVSVEQRYNSPPPLHPPTPPCFRASVLFPHLV